MRYRETFKDLPAVDLPAHPSDRWMVLPECWEEAISLHLWQLAGYIWRRGR